MTDIPLKKSNNCTHVKYIIVEINHDNDMINQSNHLAGDKYDYGNVLKILHQTNDLNDAIVHLSQFVSKAIEDKAIKLDKLIINDKTVQIFDWSKGWVTKHNKLILTYTIVESS